MRIKKFEGGGKPSKVEYKKNDLGRFTIETTMPKNQIDSTDYYSNIARAEQARLTPQLIALNPKFKELGNRIATNNYTRTQVDSIINKDYPELLHVGIPTTPIYQKAMNYLFKDNAAHVENANKLGVENRSIYSIAPPTYGKNETAYADTHAAGKILSARGLGFQFDRIKGSPNLLYFPTPDYVAGQNQNQKTIPVKNYKVKSTQSTQSTQPPIAYIK